MLLSETHFAQNSYLLIPNYTLYHTTHLAGTARGGTAIIIKNTIKHHPLPNYSRDYLQATSASVEDSAGHLTITAVCLPPKHTVCKAQLEDFYNTLGPRFIAGGDYNAKHNDWGSRLIITPRDREVHKTLVSNNTSHLSMGHPTYWPSDVHKIPDLVDFCVTKGIPPDFAVIHSYPRSVHSPVLVALTSQPILSDPPPSISNRLTTCDYFKYLINQRLLLQIPLMTTDDIEEAVKFFTDTVQWAGWKETPPLPARSGINACPLIIQQQLAAKRKLRRDWHHFRTPESKRLLNAATQDLKQLIRTIKNDQAQTFLQELTPRQPPTTPCGRQLKTLNASHFLYHQCGRTSVLRRTVTLTRRTLLLITYWTFFNPTPRKINQQMMKLSCIFSKQSNNHYQFQFQKVL
jgi:hypothetical protein